VIYNQKFGRGKGTTVVTVDIVSQEGRAVTFSYTRTVGCKTSVLGRCSLS
jgi:hypothetical protein